MAYGVTTVYDAEIADVSRDGKQVRIVKTREGPQAHLHPDLDEDVATMDKEQAERLLESLKETLERI